MYESKPNPGDLVRILDLKENEDGSWTRVANNELGIVIDKGWHSDLYYEILVDGEVIIVLSADVEVMSK